MGIFNLNINRKSNKSPQTGWEPIVQAIQRVWTKPPLRDAAELPNYFHKSPQLAPVAAIARAVASTEYQVLNKIDYRKNGDSATPIIDHEILDLLDNPIRRYPEMDSYFLFYFIEAITKLLGECYVLKVRDPKNGKLVELNPIPPAWVMTIPTVGTPFYTVYPFGTASARTLTVSPDDMIVFKRPNLTDPYGRGRGDSEALEQEFVTDEALSSMQEKFAYNDATPPYIITAPGMPKDQADAFKQGWMQKLGGTNHRREPGILGFDAKVQTLAMSPVELDMMDSRKFIHDMSREYYQIPPEIMGNVTNSNRATIDSSYFLYHKNVLCYEYGLLERTLTRQLVQVEYDKSLIFKFKPDIPEDEEHKLSVYNSGLTSGAVTVDEWRKANNLPELPNGKGKVFLRGFAIYEVPADGSNPEPEKPAESNQTTEAPTDDELLDAEPIEEASKAIHDLMHKHCECESIKDSVISIVSDKAIDEKEARKVAIWKAFDSRATSHEGEFISAVKKFSGEQKRRLIATIEDNKIESAIKDNTYNVAIDSILEKVFTEQSNKALKSALAPAWISSLEGGREHFYEMMGDKSKSVKAVPKINPSFTVTNRLFNEFVESVGLLKAEGINDTTNEKLRKKLSQAISDGISNGDTINTIKNSILDVCDGVYEEMDAVRALTIARTESACTMNAGTIMSGQAEGMTLKQWLSVRDSRTRSPENYPNSEFDHLAADGEIVGINDDFMATGEPLAFPVDPKGSAGNCVNCRCAILISNEEIGF